MKFSLIFIATVLGSALATPVALSPEAAIELRAPPPKAPGTIIITLPKPNTPVKPIIPFPVCPKPTVPICPKPIIPPCKCKPLVIKVPYCPLPKFPKFPKIF